MIAGNDGEENEMANESDHKERRGKQDQLESHSLPGTNQAGDGPGDCEEPDQHEKTGATDNSKRPETKSHPGGRNR
jgi:hypothetical protein